MGAASLFWLTLLLSITPYSRYSRQAKHLLGHMERFIESMGMTQYPLDSLYPRTGRSGVRKPGCFSNKRPKAMRALEQNALLYKFPEIVFPYSNTIKLYVGCISQVLSNQAAWFTAAELLEKQNVLVHVVLGSKNKNTVEMH